ncbi:MAG TPA: 50S ribosomal protein L9 [Actinomycetota bacterium]|nr:50S ribosomal protein L9 [Actinomycetota bacterium]
MRIILQKEVEKLGAPGDIVQVADGYARNYLIPRGFAVPASKGAVRHSEKLKAGHDERQRRARAEAQELATRLAKTPVRIQARAGEEGRLFGSITAQEIADELSRALEQPIDRRRMSLDEPIRSIGVHSVRVHLHPEVDANVTVDVVAQ